VYVRWGEEGHRSVNRIKEVSEWCSTRERIGKVSSGTARCEKRGKMLSKYYIE
jgi:hypothetical protein